MEKNPSPPSGARRLATQSVVYAIGNAAIKASGVLLAPLYLNAELLPRAEYGRLGLLEITGQLCILTAGLGLTAAMIRFSSDHDDEDRAAAPGSALIAAATSGLVMAAAFWLLAGPLAEWLLNDGSRAGTIRWYGGYVLFQSIVAVPYAFIRLRERAVLFVVARLSEIAVLIIGVFVFLARMRLGLEGIVYAFVLSSGVAALLLIVGMASQARIRFSGPLVRRMLRYGAPLAIGSLALPVLHAGDRYILDAFRGSETVALYYWGSRLSGLLNMLFVQSVSMALVVVGVKVLAGPEHDVSLHRRTFRHFTVWAGWGVLVLSLFAHEITTVLTDDPRYPLAAPLVLPLSLGYLFYGHYVVFSNTLLVSGRTHVIGANVFIAAVFNIVLNLILIPRFGMWGAAAATVVSYLLLALLTAAYARRDYPVDYTWRGAAFVIALVVALYVAGSAVGEGTVLSFGIRVLIGLAYLPLVVLLRVYKTQEIREALTRIRAAVGQRPRP